MNGLIAACGLVLLVLVLSMTLKKDAPAIAFLLTLTAGVLILLRAFALVGGTMQRFSGLLAQGGITQSLYSAGAQDGRRGGRGAHHERALPGQRAVRACGQAGDRGRGIGAFHVSAAARASA